MVVLEKHTIENPCHIVRIWASYSTSVTLQVTALRELWEGMQKKSHSSSTWTTFGPGVVASVQTCLALTPHQPPSAPTCLWTLTPEQSGGLERERGEERAMPVWSGTSLALYYNALFFKYCPAEASSNKWLSRNADPASIPPQTTPLYPVLSSPKPSIYILAPPTSSHSSNGLVYSCYFPSLLVCHRLFAPPMFYMYGCCMHSRSLPSPLTKKRINKWIHK